MKKIGETSSQYTIRHSLYHQTKWCLSYDVGEVQAGSRQLIFLNIFNSFLKGLCTMPIIASLKITFYQVWLFFVMRKDMEACIGQDGFCPTQISVTLTSYDVKGRTTTVCEYSVSNLGAHAICKWKQDNKLDQNSWQICTIKIFHVKNPCSLDTTILYAVSQHLSLDRHQYISHWYWKTTFMHT